MKYYINYNYGMHHIEIETTEDSFYKTIDNISKEFTIWRMHYVKTCGNNREQYFYKTDQTHYFIYDYLGDREEIGKVIY